LRSWTPRRPSAGLERRLWPAPPRVAHRSRVLPWLAPAMACGLLAILTLSQHGAARFSDDRQGMMLGMMLSNQSYAAYLPNSCQANNRLDTFEWTNGGGSASSMRFVSPDRGNE